MEAIRTNDPKLTATDKPHFDDADFDEQKGVKSKQSKPLMTLKDQIRKHTLKKMDKKGDQSDDSDGESSGSEDDLT